VSGNAPTINNQAGALFDMQSDADFIRQVARLVFNNAGTLRKSMGTQTSWLQDAAFTNTGTINIGIGTLWVDGSFFQTGGSTLLSGGSLGSSVTLNFNGGSLIGGGSVFANIFNSGRVAAGNSPGILSINGNYTQSAVGTLEIEVGGLVAGPQFDRFAITGNSSLNGTLDIKLSNGFVPAIGNTFQIMTFASRSGTFSVTNGTAAGLGHRFRPDYATTAVTLAVTNGGPPTFWSTGLTNGLVLLRWQGEPNARYQLDAATNVPFTTIPAKNWVSLILTNPPSGLLEFVESQTTNYPRRFYRALVVP
jgi:hypothetical protein